MKRIFALLVLGLVCAMGYSQTPIRKDAFPPIPEKNDTKVIQMATTLEQMYGWDRYPTYETYLAVMEDFAEKYPAICKIDTIGKSVSNRLILCAVISDNVGMREAEPEFIYSSTIHGDEVTGFYEMLRLIDTLLNGYGKDDEITQLIDNTQIYINPLANPDGTYRGGNSNLSNAMRYNKNYVDLNRNYPDPFGSDPFSGVQVENQAYMAYIAQHNFVASATLHGGAEVMNYPWDSYTSPQNKHADRDWWIGISKRFVDTCRKVSTSCFKDVENCGYTAGGDWYVIPNGRQDYMNYYAHVREITMEISSTKTPSSDKLCNYWNIHRQSYLNYIKEVQFGIRGTVKDAQTEEPLKAMIVIVNHDKDSSQIYSNPLYGDFYRPIEAGTYSVMAIALGYKTKILQNIVAEEGRATYLDILLNQGDGEEVSIAQGEDNAPILVYPNPTDGLVWISNTEDGTPIIITNIYSQRMATYPCGTTCIDLKGYSNGIYLLNIGGKVQKVVKQ